jgi:hypothetical protein
MCKTLLFVVLTPMVLAALFFCNPIHSYAKPELPDPTKRVVPQMNMARLTPPHLPPHPTQADVGAQRYWLYCQPCHGDHGQGLTAEWRDQYPPEEQNCWQAGCHGATVGPQAFKLPTLVPALMGAHTLQRFTTAADLHAFLVSAMPYQAPGKLSDDDYWALTAFLLHKHGLPDAALPLRSVTQAQSVVFHPAKPKPAPPVPADHHTFWLSLEISSVAFAVVFGLSWLKKFS